MKERLKQIIRLIKSPQTEWSLIALENATIGHLRVKIILPFMCCVLAAMLFNAIMGIDNFTFETLLKECSKRLVICISSIFIGYHIAVLLVSGKLTEKIFKKKPCYPASARIVAYPFALFLIIKFIYEIIQFFFIYAALAVLPYVIWHSISSHFPDLEEENHTKFTIYAFLIICSVPLLMEKLMSILMSL
ncbi:MAG: hypothetical protein MJZ14_08205 [Paludibacteraceae bacterium]|nr:hypothetical protein [Paludibacteraceae bacterium]